MEEENETSKPNLDAFTTGEKWFIGAAVVVAGVAIYGAYKYGKSHQDIPYIPETGETAMDMVNSLV
jgi:hypothetical protein